MHGPVLYKLSILLWTSSNVCELLCSAEMFCTYRTVLMVVIVAPAILFASASAQDPYITETLPVRGLMPYADQISSPIDNIDPVSGKVSLSIPLGSLPPGRGGSGFDVMLVYDSHVHDLVPTEIVSQLARAETGL